VSNNDIYDAIIVGSGIAGLSTAIMLKEKGFEPLVITKSNDILETNTRCAQGGIIAYREDDDPMILADDIFKAGSYYNYKDAVYFLSKIGPKLVFDFLIDKVGVDFDKSSFFNGKSGSQVIVPRK